MNEDNCLFCKIVLGQIPATKIYENDNVLSFLDIGPVTTGHTLIIPKQHYEKVDQCPPEILGLVFSCMGKVAGAVCNAMNADGYNVLCNNGQAAGQVIGHLHFHIIPRTTGDGVFDHWPSFKYAEGKIEEIAEQISKML